MNELNELKAQAYDLIVQIEAHHKQIGIYQQQLAIVNKQIREYKIPLPELPPLEEVVAMQSQQTPSPQAD